MYLGAEGFPLVTAFRHTATAGWPSRPATPTRPASATTGRTRSGPSPSGTYVACVEHQDPEFVTAFPRTCTGVSPTPQGGEPFEVVAGETTTGIDIPTDRAGEISGRVNGATGPVRVDLYTGAGRLALSQNSSPTAPIGCGRSPRGPTTSASTGARRPRRSRPSGSEQAGRPGPGRRDPGVGERRHRQRHRREPRPGRRDHGPARRRHRRPGRRLPGQGARPRRVARGADGPDGCDRRVRDRWPQHGAVRRAGQKAVQRRRGPALLRRGVPRRTRPPTPGRRRRPGDAWPDDHAAGRPGHRAPCR